MAYGGDVALGWVEVMSNGKYAVDDYIYYQLDETNRKIRVIVDNQRIRSLSNYYSYNFPVNNGFQLLGGTNDSQYGRVWDVDMRINVPAGGSFTCGVNKRAAVYSYDSNGNISGVLVASQMIMAPAGYNATYYGFLQKDWNSIDISSRLPKISKEIQSPSNVMVDPATVGTTRAKVSWVGSSKATSYEVTITGGGSTSTYTTNDNYYYFINLQRGTKYTVSIVAKDANGNKSSATNIDFTTRNQSRVYVKDEGKGKRGYVFVKVDGKLVRAVNIWVNVNGEPKRLKD